MTDIDFYLRTILTFENIFTTIGGVSRLTAPPRGGVSQLTAPSTSPPRAGRRGLTQ